VSSLDNKDGGPLMKTPLLLALIATAQAPAAATRPERPNVLLIITDDQGYGDFTAHGNPVLKTPNLDLLRSQSVRFSDFQVSPTCAPTRASLLTGRHEFHSGVTHTINERERLALTATTLPQLLKTTGYATGIFGKWHQGDEDAYQPGRRGFDEVFIHGAGGIGQTYPGSCGDAPGNSYFDPIIRHNGRFEKTRGYCTDVFFEQAWRWIESRKGQGEPFFAYIATNAPHAPLDVPPEYEKKYAGLVPFDAAKFFGMIANIDDNVGTLMGRLAASGLDRDTVVIFLTDNGGTAGVKVFNDGMRGQKGTPWRGGTRVPLWARWPGVLTPGDRPQLAAHIDLFPTLAQVAGAMVPADVAAKLDGRSLLPLLLDRDADWPDRALVTHVGRWDRVQAAESKYKRCSIRSSRFALVNDRADGAKAWHLFDLEADPGQKTNVIDRFPEEAHKLEAAYDAWWASVLPDLVNEDAVGPAVNPFHAAYWEQFPEEKPKDGAKGPRTKRTADREASLLLYQRSVRPLLVEHCYECHSARAARPESGLRLDTADGPFRGGATGPAVVPGDPDGSMLIRALDYASETARMPPKGKLPDAKIEPVRRWVATGAAINP
jgi:arylsulfatase